MIRAAAGIPAFVNGGPELESYVENPLKNVLFTLNEALVTGHVEKTWRYFRQLLRQPGNIQPSSQAPHAAG
jgi:hypothetical protein